MSYYSLFVKRGSQKKWVFLSGEEKVFLPADNLTQALDLREKVLDKGG
jgi:hypothetical protein